MNHLDNRFEALVDGSLDEAERHSALAHIEGCPDCRLQYELALRIPRLLSPDSDPPAPAGLADEVLRQAGHRRRRRGAPAHLLLAAAVAAGVALAGAAAGLAGTYQPALLRPPALISADPPAPAAAPVSEAETSSQVPVPVRAPAASPESRADEPGPPPPVSPSPSRPASATDAGHHGPTATPIPVRPTPLAVDLDPLSSPSQELTEPATGKPASDPGQEANANSDPGNSQVVQPKPPKPAPPTWTFRPRRPPASTPCPGVCD